MNWFRSLIAAITVSWGWRRLLVACLAGSILALALAPIFFLPALFVSFPILVWLLDGVTEPGPGDRRLGIYIQAFGIGWAFGFGYFLAGLYWVGFAFLVDAADFAWMLPFVAVALPGGLAIFIGLATVIARALAGLDGSRGAGRCLVLAASWTAIEAARGTILTGFAWNRVGQAMAGSDALLQGAAFVGDLGLTFFLVAIASAPATLADREGHLRGWRSSAVALVALGALWVAGDYRLSQAKNDNVEGVRLRIVQPSISQKEKWVPANRSRIIADYLELSDAATSPQSMGIEGVTYLVWPETALPLLLQSEPGVIAAIAALLPADTILLTGGVRTAPRPGGGRDVFNSVLAFDGEGRLLDQYDKQRLVPFGEYLPFQDVLERWGIGQLTRLPGGFSAGTGKRVMNLGGGPAFAPLICYEIIFSGNVAPAEGEQTPSWILNLTNDAWFGDSAGPYQHLAQARFRAVEEGIPVIRAANTGISVVVDPFGRIVDQIELNQRGVLDANLPKSIDETIYRKIRNYPTIMLIFVIFIARLWQNITTSGKTNM